MLSHYNCNYWITVSVTCSHMCNNIFRSDSNVTLSLANSLLFGLFMPPNRAVLFIMSNRCFFSCFFFFFFSLKWMFLVEFGQHVYKFGNMFLNFSCVVNVFCLYLKAPACNFRCRSRQKNQYTYDIIFGQ